MVRTSSKVAIQALVFGILIMAGTVVLAQDPPAPQPLPQAPVPAQSMESSESLHGSEDCDCLRCRLANKFKRCPCKFFCHDKCYWHWYIEGNGPAIHTRPAGIYWW